MTDNTNKKVEVITDFEVVEKKSKNTVQKHKDIQPTKIYIDNRQLHLHYHKRKRKLPRYKYSVKKCLVCGTMKRMQQKTFLCSVECVHEYRRVRREKFKADQEKFKKKKKKITLKDVLLTKLY